MKYQVAARYLVYFFFVWRFIQVAGYTAGLENLLSPVADPYSEADTIRAAQSYAERGFARDSFLPDIYYGGQFPSFGEWSQHPEMTSKIYTHCPPGPYWLAGIYAKFLGVRNIGRFRIFPVLLNLLCIAFLFACILRARPRAGPWLCIFWLTVPMFYNMAHGLYYQSYSFAFLAVQVALMISLVPGRVRMFAILFALLGFAQGWQSFDFFFVVSLANLALAVLVDPSVRRARNFKWIYFGPALGFAFAHALHFLEVAHYWGSARLAFNDLFVAASERSDLKAVAPDYSSLKVWWLYMTEYLPHKKFFGTSPWVLFAISLVMYRAFAEKAIWWALLGSFAASSLWIFAMPQHALIHSHFLPRHFFLFFFTWSWILTTYIEKLWRSDAAKEWLKSRRRNHPG